jgi:hypothetical protein
MQLLFEVRTKNDLKLRISLAVLMAHDFGMLLYLATQVGKIFLFH